MHIHILGICGTFMGSLALLARQLGYQVTGSDANVYPPMSTQLQTAGIEIMQGYAASHLQPAPDLVVVGNAMKRGLEVVEFMLNQGIPYTSGPQFLAETVLQHRHVLAVAGTHGKTTTTTMLAWILQYAGIDTGFLIGGVPLVASDEPRLQQIFSYSSHLGQPSIDNQTGYFVIEADEYDSAFFDKRSKFVHYRPKTAILNNLEFDHADIFADLSAIQTQFHHLVRTIPSEGQIIAPIHETHIDEVLEMGCWSPVVRTGFAHDENAMLQAQLLVADGSHFAVIYQDQVIEQVQWSMTGRHNVSNALVAILAAHHVGVEIATACQALCHFAGIKRRMELIATVGSIDVYDDFAHHPTAIEVTLDGARKKFAKRKIWAVIEPRSNTMKLGVYQSLLATSAQTADRVIWYQVSNLDWSLTKAIDGAKNQQVFDNVEQIITTLVAEVADDDVIIIMSNGGFEGIYGRLVSALQQRS